MIHDCSVSAQEMKEHGPHIRSALLQYKRKVDFLGVWSSEHYRRWKLSTLAVDLECGHYSCHGGFSLPNVATSENTNLTSVQKDCFDTGSWVFLCN